MKLNSKLQSDYEDLYSLILCNIMVREERIICKVWKNKKADQKLVTIPKERKDILEGDYIEVKKIK